MTSGVTPADLLAANMGAEPIQAQNSKFENCFSLIKYFTRRFLQNDIFYYDVWWEYRTNIDDTCTQNNWAFPIFNLKLD